MSLHLEFEPHTYYKGFAIYDNRDFHIQAEVGGAPSPFKWHAFTDNGMTYRIDELASHSLKDLKTLINDYHIRQAERDAYNRQLIGE